MSNCRELERATPGSGVGEGVGGGTGGIKDRLDGLVSQLCPGTWIDGLVPGLGMHLCERVLEL